MSIRVLFCFAYVIGFSFYAWRNWFVSACASIILMAFFQHPDMPKNLGGIQGLNPWNVLVGNVALAWLNQRARRGFDWDMPKLVSRAMWGFSIVIFWGFIRMAIDPANLFGYSFTSGFSDYFINNVKWLLIAAIFFDTVRTRKQVVTAMACVIGLYFLLGVQIIRWVPLQYAVASGEDFAHIAYKLIQNEIGYNRVTLSMMLGGASWSALAFLPFVKGARNKLLIFGVFCTITIGQALTGGRTGYVSWAAVGFIVCVVRWRKLLLLVPVVLFAVAVFLPAVRDRMMFGVGDNPADATSESSETGTAKMTSGRTIIWPYVLARIGKSPILGYGRMAMQRTGLTNWLLVTLDEDNFGHPHNAYLEQLFDNGIIGFCLAMPIYFISLRRSFSLFLDKHDSLCVVAGGVACSLILALMVGALAGQTFYPREGAAGMWAAIGVMLRVWVERAKFNETGVPMFSQPGDEATEPVPVETVA